LRPQDAIGKANSQSPLRRGSSEEGSQLKTIKAGLNLSAVSCDDGAIPESLSVGKVLQAMCQTGPTNPTDMPVNSDNQGCYLKNL